VVQVIYCLQPVDNYEGSLPLKGIARAAHGWPCAWSESPGKNQSNCPKPHLRDVVSSRRVVGRCSGRCRLKAHGRGFRSRHSQRSSDNVLVSTNVRHLAKNVFVQIWVLRKVEVMFFHECRTAYLCDTSSSRARVGAKLKRTLRATRR